MPVSLRAFARAHPAHVEAVKVVRRPVESANAPARAVSHIIRHAERSLIGFWKQIIRLPACAFRRIAKAPRLAAWPA